MLTILEIIDKKSLFLLVFKVDKFNKFTSCRRQREGEARI